MILDPALMQVLNDSCTKMVEAKRASDANLARMEDISRQLCGIDPPSDSLRVRMVANWREQLQQLEKLTPLDAATNRRVQALKDTARAQIGRLS